MPITPAPCPHGRDRYGICPECNALFAARPDVRTELLNLKVLDEASAPNLVAEYGFFPVPVANDPDEPFPVTREIWASEEPDGSYDLNYQENGVDACPADWSAEAYRDGDTWVVRPHSAGALRNREEILHAATYFFAHVTRHERGLPVVVSYRKRQEAPRG
jgi:hypothetical protein